MQKVNKEPAGEGTELTPETCTIIKDTAAAMDPCDPYNPQPWTPASSSGLPWTPASSSYFESLLRPVGLDDRLALYISEARERSHDVFSMVQAMAEALLSDDSLLWWATVTPHPILRDICETTKPTWTANFHDVSFLALRAALSTINSTGDEADILGSYQYLACYPVQPRHL